MRFLTRIFASLSVLFILGLTILFSLLSSAYNVKSIQYVVSSLSPYRFEAKSIEYDVRNPFTVSIHQPQFFITSAPNSPPDYSASYLSVTLNPIKTLTHSLTLQQLTVKDIALTDKNKSFLPENTVIAHLALDNVSAIWSDGDFKKADIQLTQWTNTSEPWGTWQGDFQFSAPKVTIGELSLRDILFHGRVEKDFINLMGLSFFSPLGNVTSQAHINHNRVNIKQITISDSTIESSKQLASLDGLWQRYANGRDILINRLDLLNVSGTFPELNIDHLTLSVNQLNFQDGKIHWQEAGSTMSFNAELLQTHDRVFTDVLADVTLEPQKLTVNAFSAQVDDKGFVSFAGKFSPRHLHFDSLTANSIEWDTAFTMTNQWMDWRSIEQLDIKKINLRNITLSHLDPIFPMQWFGINLKGRNLTVIDKSHWGYWAGDLSLNATSANINHIPIKSPYINIAVKENHLILAPFNVSFDEGELTVHAELDIKNPSLPWQITATGLHLPNNLYRQWLSIPLYVEGEHDLELHATGLASGWDSFAYSLSGYLKATPINSLLPKDPHASLTQTLFPFDAIMTSATTQPINVDIEDVQITAKRGVIQLQPLVIHTNAQEAIFKGEWDLVNETGQWETVKDESKPLQN